MNHTAPYGEGLDLGVVLATVADRRLERTAQTGPDRVAVG